MNKHTFAFYNIENLFDIVDDKHTNDDDFLPDSKKRWTPKRYHNKIKKLGNVIANIGKDKTSEAPVVVGLAEVENKTVLNDLVNSKFLADEAYDFVHYDSSDERGIDVALLYKPNLFTVEHSETFSVYLEDEEGQRDYTRDVLLVSGTFKEQPIHIIVNHWSSRRGGEDETEYKRIEASKTVNRIISDLNTEDTNAIVLVMGDFNDNPNDKSIHLMEYKSQLYNPFKTVWSRDIGSLSHDFEWNLFDQILCSTNVFDINRSKLIFHRARVYNKKFLTLYNGKYKGQPFRTYVGKKYKGGYSDHFPVYIEMKSKN